MFRWFSASLILFTMLFSENFFSQTITWTDISQQRQLPDGVKAFSGTRPSPALKVWYVDVDMDKKFTIKPYITPEGREVITALSQRYQAIAAVNGGYFDMTSGALYSAVIQPDKVLANNITAVVRSGITYFLTRAFWGLKDDRTMSVDWIYHFGSKVTDVYKFAAPTNNVAGTPAPLPDRANGQPLYEYIAGIGGGPCLLKDGQVYITYNQEVFWDSGVALSSRQPRTAIGFTPDNHVILLVADGRQTISDGLTLPELAQVMQGLGCTNAMNLDGGGSSQMCVKNTVLNLPDGSTSLRLLPSILAVVPVDSLPLLPPVTYVKKTDTNDSSYTFTGVGWTASTLTGYWGSIPSQIVKGGDGSAYVTFKPKIKKPGVYKISLWWTSTTNRAVNVPCYIYHDGKLDSVFADQSINGSKWNSIGDYYFAGNDAEKLLIKNSVPDTKYIVVDGIRVTSGDSSLLPVQHEKLLPVALELSQNYPNPFNPRTTIRYSVPGSSFVQVRVFDILGRSVTTLVEREHQSGTYSVDFNASAIASGIYIYSLNAGGITVSKKMIVIK
ncbi:MAG: phosphodiester glycosidase family protein [Ignavibacteriales bacterium]|nr:phosphodiester glycosidase family protein [Ignavibacteriales bacterium]